MPDDLIKYAFVGGVLSPKLFGRTDLEKFDLGLAEGMNWFVDYQGGITTRPGLEFVDYTLFNDAPTKFVPFRFAPNLANTYVIMFSNQAIHFFQDGAPVVEAAVSTITNITQGNPPTVTRAAHGINNNDRIVISGVVGMTEINERQFRVRNVTANSFDLYEPIAVVQAADTTGYSAYVSGGSFNRIYAITSPYLSADIPDLRAYQIRDTIRLTRHEYRVRNLTRIDHTNWVLSEEIIGNQNTRPTGVAVVPSSAGQASVGFVVTAVDVDGVESLPSTMSVEDLIVNYTTTAGSVTVTWTGIANTKYYNIYRTLVLPESDSGSADDATVTRAEQVGYVGQAFAPRFVDPNIIADFTRSPPQYNDPFAHEAIEQINVTAGGAGYPVTATVTASLGSGFEGFPIVDPSGAIIAVVVLRGGQGYLGTAISFGGGGAGATAVAILSPSEGGYPQVSCIAQQRQVYAATANDPLTLWWSRAGYFDNFDISQVVSAKDAIEFEIDSEEVASILHLVEVQSGLLVMSQTGIWMLRGLEGEAITASDAIADPQNYRGCSKVPPIKIDNDLLYVEGKGTTVRLLTNYSDLTKKYTGQDVSILSNHLFDSDNKIEGWAFASNPHNLIWAYRTDGKFTPFTLVKEQDVYAWSICETQGIVTDVCTVQENGVDSTYMAVRRYIDGTWRKYVERLARRDFKHVEDAFCVDSGLSTVYNYQNVRLDVSAATGSASFFSDAAIFNSGQIGHIIRSGGGKAVITQFIHASHVIATIIRDITNVMPETLKPLQSKPLSWSIDPPLTSIGGMWHIEGQTVQILADGNVLPPQVVVDGRVPLVGEPSTAKAGLKFTCTAKTLPITASGVVIEGKLKRPISVGVRVYNTRGLKVGDTVVSNDLYEMKERTDELYGEPTRLQQDNKFVTINARFDVNGQVYIVQDQPLPATVIGLITSLEVGDD